MMGAFVSSVLLLAVVVFVVAVVVVALDLWSVAAAGCVAVGSVFCFGFRCSSDQIFLRHSLFVHTWW